MFLWIALSILIIVIIAIKVALPYIVFPVNLMSLETPATNQTFVNCGDNRIATLKVGEQFADERPIVVYSHGNAEYLTKRRQDHFEDLAATWKTMIVLYDYPGYGKSTGTPSESGVNDCIDSVIRSLGVDDNNLVLIGRSIGSGPTIKWASKHQPRGVVLISPFASIIRTKLPFSIPGLDMFPSLKVIKDVRCSILICHGRNDNVVPHEHGKLLTDKAQHVKLVTKEAGHNDLQCDEDIQRFLSEIKHVI